MSEEGLFGPIRATEQLPAASAPQLRAQLRYEVMKVLEDRGLNQKQLSQMLDYRYDTDVSKWLSGERAVSKSGADRLDQIIGETSLGIKFAVLRSALTAKEGRRRNATKSAGVWDVFLASPMAATKDDAQYEEISSNAKDFCTAIQTYCGLSRVKAPALEIAKRKSFDTYAVARRDNFKAIADSTYFVLISIDEIPKASSVLVEAGYALAIQKPSVYFVPNDDALPYILRGFGQFRGEPGSPLAPVFVHPVANWETALALVRQNRRTLFPA